MSVIDLSQLPAPEIVEPLDFETLLQLYYSDFIARDPSYSALVESDPAIINLQTCAYREMLLRNRINEAAKANWLAYALGADLDQKAADYGVIRLTGESDERLRYRCQLSLEGFSTAGPTGAYRYYALSSSVKVKSVSVLSPSAGVVQVTVLSTEGSGIPNDREQINNATIRLASDMATLDGKAISDLVVMDENGKTIYLEGHDYVFDVTNSLLMRLSSGNIPENSLLLIDYKRADTLELVRLALNDETIRPLTDCVVVQASQIVPYTIKASITVYPGPSFAVIEEEGRALLQTYVEERHVMGGLVALSGIYDALHMSGVQKVEIASPLADIETSHIQAPFCTGIELTAKVVYE